jgi:hypothetical protein
MQDNAILQRTLYKYEQTLNDLDSVFRGAHGNDVILDLKRITEKQLKEIVMLQKEIEIVKYNSNGFASPNSFNNTRRGGRHDLDNEVWSHTADLKSPRRAGNSKHLVKTL